MQGAQGYSTLPTYVSWHSKVAAARRGGGAPGVDKARGSTQACSRAAGWVRQGAGCVGSRPETSSRTPSPGSLFWAAKVKTTGSS